MSQPRPVLRVVKVGGSLLTWPELPRAIERWLAVQPPAISVFLAGGGRFADEVRAADRRFGLGEEASHWLAIDALSLTSRLLSSITPFAPYLVTFAELQQHIGAGAPGVVVFDPREFLSRHEAQCPGTPLRHTWQATSDSIAARLAEVIGADELILLKAAAPPVNDLTGLGAAGYVDEHFPAAARHIRRIQCIRLPAG